MVGIGAIGKFSLVCFIVIVGDIVLLLLFG